MILTRLYELAHRPGERILEDTRFESVPVAFVVVVDRGGVYCGIEDRREWFSRPSRKKGEPPRLVPNAGRLLSVPRPHGNTATPGFARYFADTLPRVLPIPFDPERESTAQRQRQTFWEQMRHAADDSNDPALRAVADFGDQLLRDPALVERLRGDLEKLSPQPEYRCTFSWYPDRGRTIVERPDVRQWYIRFFDSVTAERQQEGPVGVCQITGEFGPLPTSHRIRFSGVPGGLGTGVSLISFDNDSFRHYGWDRAANAGIGYPATQAYCLALEALIRQTLAHNSRTRLVVGNTLFLFWTRRPAGTDWMSLFEESLPEEAQALFESLTRGQEAALDLEDNDFYVLALSANAARAIVRDYLERPLGQARAAISAWFNDLRITDASRQFQGRCHSAFPLGTLAAATAVEPDQVAPDVHTRLMRSALTGSPLPDSVLAACLRRLRAERESRNGFRPARMALIKLFLLRRGIPMTEELNPDDRHPAYLCGRLLAVLAEVQECALGDVNAGVVDRFYGRFSTAPGFVLGNLIKNAQHHLSKIEGENRGAYVNLDRRLTEIMSLLPPCLPHDQFSLVDQGRFALGYYHEKARRWARLAASKKAPRQDAPDAPDDSSDEP